MSLHLGNRFLAFALYAIALTALVASVGAAAFASAQTDPAPADAAAVDPAHSIYSCPPGATLDGNSCILGAAELWVPGQYESGSGPVGSCPSGWELNGVFCSQAPVVAQQTCPEGGAADPESIGEDGRLGRCVAEPMLAQAECPAGYIAVDDTCFAEPVDAVTCPAGGEPDPDEIAADGTVLACRAQPVAAVAGCPANYLDTDGVCTATPIDPEQPQTCAEGELVDGKCRINAKFMSGPNATCNGEPTTKPAADCGTWERKGGERVPATVNTAPTAVPIPMTVLGDQSDVALDAAPGQTPALDSPEGPNAFTGVQSPSIDLGAGTADGATTESAPEAAETFTLTTVTPSVLSPTPTGSAQLSASSGDAPNYEWGAGTEASPKRRSKLAFTGSAAKPLVVTALGMMVSGFMAVEFNRRLRKHDARKHLPRRFR